MVVTNDTACGCMILICRAIGVKFEAMNGGWFPTASNGFSGTGFAGVRKVMPFGGQSNGPSRFEWVWESGLEADRVSIFPNGPTSKGKDNGPRN